MGAAFRLARLSPFTDHVAVDPFRRVSPVLGSTFPTFMPHMHAEMDRMFDMMLSPRVRSTAPGLEAEDREFLAGEPPNQDQQKTDESSEACQENTPRSHSAAWSSSSFSSFSSSGGGPAVQTTTKRVYDSDTARFVRSDAVLLATSWSWSTASTATMAKFQRLAAHVGSTTLRRPKWRSSRVTLAARQISVAVPTTRLLSRRNQCQHRHHHRSQLALRTWRRCTV